MTTPHTALVVDDEPDVVQSLHDLLRLDYRVLGVTSGRDALEVLRRDKVEVILTDQRMPDMSGIELLRRVRDEFPDTMRLLMTGYGELQTVVDAINVGSVYRYIPKPWEPLELQSIVQSACQCHELNRQRQQLAIQVSSGKDRAELQRLRALLSSRRDLANVLQVVARRIVKVLEAKACEIYLAPPAGGNFVLRAAASVPPYENALRAAHLPDAAVLQQTFAADATLCGTDLLGVTGLRAVTRPLGAAGQHAVFVPLSFKGVREGVLVLRLKPGMELPGAALALLETMAAEIAAALIDARLHAEVAHVAHMRRALALAEQVQRQMMPQGPPNVPDFDIATVYRPSEMLAGDFYDFIDLPPGNLGIVVCDVIDKGVRASLLMAAVRASLRAHAVNVYDMRSVMGKVNRDFCAEVRDGDFATMFYGVLNYMTRCLTFSGAGHCPALLCQQGRIVELNSGGTVLGIDPEACFLLDHVLLEPGDVVLIYTDGLVESTNATGGFFGYQRLRSALANAVQQGASAEGIAHGIINEVEAFAGVQAPSDDRTLVVIRAL